jgi:hypothetical protein
LGAAVSSATRVTSSVSGRYLTLLVVDDQNTDWSKYFRGKRIGDYDIRVEQAEFKEITVTANSDGANVSMAVFRGGTRVGRSFRPDFLLVSKPVKAPKSTAQQLFWYCISKYSQFSVLV